MKKPGPTRKAAQPGGKAVPSQGPSPKAPKSSYELAMERLRAADKESGTAETPLTPSQKRDIAEARAVATSRLAEREILFRDSLRKTDDPAEREKAEHEYQIDRQRIRDDCERAIQAIRRLS